ncbi:hypothetical protein [Fischerella sp. FACHB-380]|uniref:hypothetical protein n=1 Tax=Fischerella sp. FACHB-380 TaxID=2692799 RepID=UPI0003033CDA|nr:hypothetical protein [Fischerella sp. FACHB-380]
MFGVFPTNHQQTTINTNDVSSCWLIVVWCFSNQPPTNNHQQTTINSRLFYIDKRKIPSTAREFRTVAYNL